jgi:hypothetical protein
MTTKNDLRTVRNNGDDCAVSQRLTYARDSHVVASS